MRKFLLLSAVSISFLANHAQTWPIPDTSGGRYCSEVFTSVTVTSGVVYGSSVTVGNSTQTLLMDIYQPTGDTVSRRPVIVLAHGGSFIGGSKTDAYMVTICTRLAKLGYVTVSLEYRIGIGFPIDSINATKAVIRATQDMKAGLRFFRQDALGANTYKTHPNYVYAGGVSAGAFMGLHLAYLDKIAEVPTWVNIASLGGIDGNSGNPGYSHKTNAVINLCGALGDSTWLEPGDCPLLSMHGNIDATVPFGTAMIYVLSFPIMVVDGSASIKVRADNVGVPNTFYPWWGQDHTPFISNATYMDSAIWAIRDFLCPLVVQPSSTGIEDMEEQLISVYPNPAQGHFIISTPGNFDEKIFSVYDLTGKRLLNIKSADPFLEINVASFNAGIYLVRVELKSGAVLSRKIVIE